jgi:carbonic anhydrase/acetyltransferase-like protein (isoleucine patch superfamily)
MAVHPYRDREPRIDPTAFIAPGAVVAGDVEIGPEASVWFNAVVRGDSDHVTVGARTNVQDTAVLHTDPGEPCEIGDECTIGHGAIVHGCRIGRGSLIGMGAVILSGAHIGDESLVAAGALVPEGRRFEPRSLVLGSPARLVRTLTDEDVEELIRPGVEHYLGYARGYRAADSPQPARSPRST